MIESRRRFLAPVALLLLGEAALAQVPQADAVRDGTEPRATFAGSAPRANGHAQPEFCLGHHCKNHACYELRGRNSQPGNS